MKTIQITNEILDEKVENKPSRFDMAMNFYCCLRQNGKYYLATYYYNPAWDLWYPFYDKEYCLFGWKPYALKCFKLKHFFIL